MTVEYATIPPAETDDLIGDFFQLVEAPSVAVDSDAKAESSGYFAETLSWLEAVDNTEKSYNMSVVYDIQNLAISQQLLCMCSQHSTIANTTMTSHAMFPESYNQAAFYGMQDSVGLDSHVGHEHCSCGGHYKDGKCEECGSLEHND